MWVSNDSDARLVGVTREDATLFIVSECGEELDGPAEPRQRDSNVGCAASGVLDGGFSGRTTTSASDSPATKTLALLTASREAAPAASLKAMVSGGSAG